MAFFPAEFTFTYYVTPPLGREKTQHSDEPSRDRTLPLHVRRYTYRVIRRRKHPRAYYTAIISPLEDKSLRCTP